MCFSSFPFSPFLFLLVCLSSIFLIANSPPPAPFLLLYLPLEYVTFAVLSVGYSFIPLPDVPSLCPVSNPYGQSAFPTHLVRREHQLQGPEKAHSCLEATSFPLFFTSLLDVHPYTCHPRKCFSFPFSPETRSARPFTRSLFSLTQTLVPLPLVLFPKL